MRRNQPALFKGRHFEAEIIILCVRRYLRFALSYRNLEELMAERKHFPRLVHPDDRKRIKHSVARSDETGLWEATYRILRRDGGIRWLHAFGRRVSAPDAVPEVWHGVSIDVTAFRAEPEVEPEMRLGTGKADRAKRSSIKDTSR